MNCILKRGYLKKVTSFCLVDTVFLHFLRLDMESNLNFVQLAKLQHRG